MSVPTILEINHPGIEAEFSIDSVGDMIIEHKCLNGGQVVSHCSFDIRSKDVESLRLWLNRLAGRD